MSQVPMGTMHRRLHEQLLHLPPACISGFAATPVKQEHPGFWCRTTFWLSCRCTTTDGNHGRVLGYSLGDYNLGYAKPVQFVSPLGYACRMCEKVTEVIDTARHGYHGMLSSSAVIRGDGPRRYFQCPTCTKEEFSLIVTFVYWQGALDEMEGEPAEKLTDYFNGFLAHGNCVGCGETSLIAGFDL